MINKFYFCLTTSFKHLNISLKLSIFSYDFYQRVLYLRGLSEKTANNLGGASGLRVGLFVLHEESMLQTVIIISIQA